MPILNGIDATKEILEMAHNNQYPIAPYIIGYSAYSDFETKERCFIAGMSDFVTKPEGWVCLAEERNFLARPHRSVKKSRSNQII